MRYKNDLILAMKPKYLKLILERKKSVEVRRTRPACPADWPDRLWLYQGGFLHGYAEVVAFHVPDLTEHTMLHWVKAKCRELHDQACLTEAEMLDYLYPAGRCMPRPILYQLGLVMKAVVPIPVPCRPQSWIYMPDEVKLRIWGEGEARP